MATGLSDSVCPRCSKPIRPGTATQLNGRALHIGCLARVTERSTSQRLLERRPARNIPEDSRRAVAETQLRQPVCPACGQSLKRGTLLFQGDDLVHAICWRAPGASEP
jgi:hypothetical protein